jgi:ribosome-associated protein
MLVATGSSSRFIHSLADKLKEFLHKSGTQDVHIEGAGTSDWVLVDGSDVIIHLFKAEVRDYYNLEKMWALQLDHTASRLAVRGSKRI